MAGERSGLGWLIDVQSPSTGRAGLLNDLLRAQQQFQAKVQ